MCWCVWPKDIFLCVFLSSRAHLRCILLHFSPTPPKAPVMEHGHTASIWYCIKSLSSALCASSKTPEQGYSANMYCMLYLCMSHPSPIRGNSDSFPAIKVAWLTHSKGSKWFNTKAYGMVSKQLMLIQPFSHRVSSRGHYYIYPLVPFKHVKAQGEWNTVMSRHISSHAINL